MRINRECARICAALWNFEAGRLPAADSTRIERHLDVCAACSAEAKRYRATVDMVRSLKYRELPASRTNWSAVRDSLEMRRRTPRLLWQRAAYAAPAFAVALCCGVLFLHSRTNLRSSLEARPPALTILSLNIPSLSIPSPGVASLNSKGRPVDKTASHSDNGIARAPVARNIPAATTAVVSTDVRRHSSGILTGSYAQNGRPFRVRHTVAAWNERGRRSRTSGPDYGATVDGGGPAARSERDFVMAQLSSGTQDAERQYVIGAVSDSYQRVTVVSYDEGVEEGRGW
jgi:hypothetical protein